MDDHILDIELGFFDQNRKKWFEHHAGKFALIKGVTVHDFYDTANRAYEVGCDIWGIEFPFLIKEVQLVDEVIFIPTIFSTRMKAIEEDQKVYMTKPEFKSVDDFLLALTHELVLHGTQSDKIDSFLSAAADNVEWNLLAKIAIELRDAYEKHLQVRKSDKD